MPTFAVTYPYTDDVATRDSVHTEHRDYLRRLAEQGLLLLSGPYGAGEAPGALLLFRADGKAQVTALVRNDPFSARGVVAETRAAEWEPVIGPLLAARLSVGDPYAYRHPVPGAVRLRAAIGAPFPRIHLGWLPPLDFARSGAGLGLGRSGGLRWRHRGRNPRGTPRRAVPPGPVGALRTRRAARRLPHAARVAAHDAVGVRPGTTGRRRSGCCAATRGSWPRWLPGRWSVGDRCAAPRRGAVGGPRAAGGPALPHPSGQDLAARLTRRRPPVAARGWRRSGQQREAAAEGVRNGGGQITADGRGQPARAGREHGQAGLSARPTSATPPSTSAAGA